MQIKVAVREHHALRVSGGAAGVEQFRDGIFVNPAEVNVGGLGHFDQLVVKLGLRPGGLGVAQGNGVRDGGSMGAQDFDQRNEFGIEEEDLRRGVVQDVGELFGA